MSESSARATFSDATNSGMMDMGGRYMQTIRRAEAVRIGRHLRYLRRAHDRTQEELASMLNVSVGWVSRIERGVKVPNLAFLVQVGKVLRVSTNELLPPSRTHVRRKYETLSQSR